MKASLGFLLFLAAVSLHGAALPGFRVQLLGATAGFASSITVDSRGTIYYTTTAGNLCRFANGGSTVVSHVNTNALGDSGLLGMALRDDSPLVKSAGVVLARMGLDAVPRAKPTSTEAGVFARAGCEAIVLGPGVSTGNAHTPNEHIEMAQLEQACDLYESLLVELCACT